MDKHINVPSLFFSRAMLRIISPQSLVISLLGELLQKTVLIYSKLERSSHDCGTLNKKLKMRSNGVGGQTLQSRN